MTGSPQTVTEKKTDYISCGAYEAEGDDSKARTERARCLALHIFPHVHPPPLPLQEREAQRMQRAELREYQRQKHQQERMRRSGTGTLNDGTVTRTRALWLTGPWGLTKAPGDGPTKLLQPRDTMAAKEPWSANANIETQALGREGQYGSGVGIPPLKVKYLREPPLYRLDVLLSPPWPTFTLARGTRGAHVPVMREDTLVNLPLVCR